MGSLAQLSRVTSAGLAAALLTRDRKTLESLVLGLGTKREEVMLICPGNLVPWGKFTDLWETAIAVNSLYAYTAMPSYNI
jgi:hypothetical protein